MMARYCQSTLREMIAKSLKLMVGAAGIEPATPTMSLLFPIAYLLILL